MLVADLVDDVAGGLGEVLDELVRGVVDELAGPVAQSRAFLVGEVLGETPEHVEMGKEVTLVWGEPNGGTTKPTVEPHEQIEIKAVISPVPYSNVARDSYADSWRQSGVGASIGASMRPRPSSKLCPPP